jgi:hypothetical protein
MKNSNAELFINDILSFPQYCVIIYSINIVYIVVRIKKDKHSPIITGRWDPRRMSRNLPLPGEDRSNNHS